MTTPDATYSFTQGTLPLLISIPHLGTEIPPELQGDIRGKILKAISREPTKKERDSMGMVGELIWNFGRMKASEYLQEQGPPGSSVTYRVTKGSQEF